MNPPDDAWVDEDPTGCAVCGRDSCEEHLPPARDPAAETAEARAAHQAILVGQELERERARREARRVLDAEGRGPVVEPTCVRLREWLASPDPPVLWRIEGWQPSESRVMLAAQRKTGKTTLVASLVRSLVDGDLWLGAATVAPVTGTVAILDTEMSSQLKRWYRDQRIQRDDRLVIFPLKGQAAALDLLDAACRSRWAATLRAHDVCYLILDNLRPVLDALGLDESHEAGRWLVGFDALLREAAIPEACLVHHMGHTGERSRGDSRLRDWPDVEWKMLRQDEDDASSRFIVAYGRDVDQPERQLAYDRATRRLTIAGGSRRDVRTEAALTAIVEVLEVGRRALSGRGIKAALDGTDHSRNSIDAALLLGVRHGRLTVETGPRNARLYRVSQCPAVSRSPLGHSGPDRVSQCPDDYRESDTADTPPVPVATPDLLGQCPDPPAAPLSPRAASRNTARTRRRAADEP